MTGIKETFRVAVINPREADGLARTILDGLLTLSERGEVAFAMSAPFSYVLPLSNMVLERKDFISFAQRADIIFLINSKYSVDIRLAEDIDAFHKTVYIDGSELGGNNRFDIETQRRVIDGTYLHKGAIHRDMLSRCARYFRREKPYMQHIIPLPFGIERRYLSHIQKRPVKDIDFFCVFGQDEYPPLRRYVRDALKSFCVQYGFTCVTQTVPSQEFYALLARSKVGISVGGGGFDTLRFWEILAADAMVITETIDIFKKGDHTLSYERITECNNLFDFVDAFTRIGEFLKTGYDSEVAKPSWESEYKKIIAAHSAEARVRTVIDSFNAATR